MVLSLHDQTAHEYLAGVEIKRGMQSRRLLERAISEERKPRSPIG